MRLRFWQKLYLCTLFVFLLFFNGSIFAIVAMQNTKALSQQKEAFTTAIAETESSITMDFDCATLQHKELAISFARKFSEIDTDQLEAIKKSRL